MRRLPCPILIILFHSCACLSAFGFVSRGDYQNITSSSASIQEANQGLTIVEGHIAEADPSGSSIQMPEVSFGQPFAQWAPDDGAYSAKILEDVRENLYPPPEAIRANIEAGDAAFRYKSLLFNPNSGETDITSHFQDMVNWYGEPERTKAKAQIAVLRDAIAHAPLTNVLWQALLDAYYDLAVAELQFTKQKLAELATMRLGFVVTGPFIIDQEINCYTGLVGDMEGILDNYQELFSKDMFGVIPSEFDPDPAVSGMPMGYYIFTRTQKNRNVTASQYLDGDTLKYVPTAGDDPEGPDPPEVRERQEADATLFAGYKDYTTLLNILGRYIQYQADLARLLGMRQAPGDLSRAREICTQMQSSIADNFIALKGMFADETFPPGDASGVNAANNAVETALADIANVRTFLNGESNLLGLNPNFLLLVQEDGGSRESFDILKDRLKGPNQPLQVALETMEAAEGRYNNFRASVDRVVQELDDVEEAYQIRFEEITGFGPTEADEFRGIAKPGSGSELEIVEQTIKSLGERISVLGELLRELEEDSIRALDSVNYSEKLKEKFLDARQVYRETTSSIYEANINWQTTAAAAQAVADGVLTAFSADLSKTGLTVAIIAAGALNGTVQAIAARVAAETERDLDLAALEFETSIDENDAELTVNMAKQEYGAIKREILAHQLETKDTLLALAEATSRQLALLNELSRIESNQRGNTEEIRSTYYADPIHYVQAESALIEADEAFRTAQRWLFYTQRALEYKWQQTFAITQGSKSWDSGTIFKLRNAKELDELLTQMVNWDVPRTAETLNSPPKTTFISLLEDVIAPNPYELNETNTDDLGTRIDFVTGEVVEKRELFRRQLQRYEDAFGFIQIPFNTVLLEDHDGNFFRGPDYLADGTIIPGTWRDRITSITVNLIAEDGTAVLQTKNGSLIYGGLTFQRTRRPLRADRTRPPISTGSAEVLNLGGEFTATPFRYWESNNFDNRFVPRHSQITSLNLAYSEGTLRGVDERLLRENFINVAFAQRSVAATDWTLIINPGQGIDIDKLQDIEIIIRHRYSDRAQPN